MTLILANELLEEGNLFGQTYAFPLETDPATGAYKLASGSEAINESIRNLCSTYVGDIPMNEDQGLEGGDPLFEDPVSLVELLPLRFVDMLRRYEPRIADVRAKARYDGESKAVIVDVTFRERSSGAKGSTVVIKPVGGEGLWPTDQTCLSAVRPR